MRSDRYTKVVLTVVALGLWALVLTGSPEEASAARQVSRQERLESETPADHAPAVTDMPLRWRVARARHQTGGYNTFCGTAVTVTNLTGSTVNAKVNFLGFLGNSLAVEEISLAAYDPDVVITNLDVEPGIADVSDAELVAFQGYALVYSDDPRIMVAGRIYCRDGLGILAAVVSDHMVPAYPVGTTAQYFQAGMPVNWAPPMAAPEVPE